MEKAYRLVGERKVNRDAVENTWILAKMLPRNKIVNQPIVCQ